MVRVEILVEYVDLRLAEAPAETEQLFGSQALVAEHQHGVPVPGIHERLVARRVELPRKVDRGDRRADGAVERLYVERHRDISHPSGPNACFIRVCRQ